ncbi:hypothetical protein [Aeromicrobium sp. 179-A 4D2 NHS]|uniref:hypothetical protein n=1 Tax=Aeromicrobium sp. 179-A 4D2 NHS TaxID=3142375 RepID=UPI0039A0D6E2
MSKPRKTVLLDTLEAELESTVPSYAEPDQYQLTVEAALDLVSALIDDDSPAPIGDADDDGNVHLCFNTGTARMLFTINSEGRDIDACLEDDENGSIVETTLSQRWRDDDELCRFRDALDAMTSRSDEYTNFFTGSDH